MFDNTIKLNIGCGDDYREGYVNIDMRLDVKCDIREEITPAYLTEAYKPKSVSHIVMHDVLEHFDRHEGEGLLRACHAIMHDEGEMSLQLPNVRNVIRIECSDRMMISRIFGRQHRPGDAHKWGYTPETITDLLYELFFFVTDFKENICTMRLTAIKTEKIRLKMEREGIECVR